MIMNVFDVRKEHFLLELFLFQMTLEEELIIKHQIIVLRVLKIHIIHIQIKLDVLNV